MDFFAVSFHDENQVSFYSESVADLEYDFTDDMFQEEDEDVYGNLLSRCNIVEHLPSPMESSIPQPQTTLAEELFLFFVLFNISNRAMEYLLKILCRHGLQCPSSLYLLLKNDRSKLSSMDITRKENFVYLGLKNTLKYVVDKMLLSAMNVSSKISLTLQINFDGLPLYKSSSVNLWPILLKIKGVTSPLPLGLFCGIGKPNLSIFLKDLLEELTELFTHGIVCENISFTCEKLIFVCDTPARTFFQAIKGHNAFNGCGYCRQVGYRYHDHTTVFQSHVGPSRSDEIYAQCGENNQLYLSPLASIVPLMTSFPLDYMHCALLGSTRKLFNFYFTRTKGMRLACKLSVSQQQLLNENVADLRTFVPKEFQRKIRAFSELQYFKASEFRTYLLYFGPVIFKNFLPTPYYNHFLKLHFAIYVFCSKSLKHLYTNAHSCLEVFVHDMTDLFGPASLVYNVHCLLHLHQFVQMYGPLDDFSAFPYENYLSIMKRRIKCTRNIFEHSMNQLLLIRDHYHSLSQPSDVLTFSSLEPNNCAVLEGGVLLLIESVNEHFVSGYKLELLKCLYEHPYDSAVLSIGRFKKSDVYLNKKKPLSKAICISSSSNEFIVIPFVN